MALWKILLTAGLIVHLGSGGSCATDTVFCYYDSSATLRQGVGKIIPQMLNPRLCTHLSYTFFGVSAEGEVQHLNFKNDITRGTLKAFTALKQSRPRIKLIASIGGPEVPSSRFSSVLRSNSLLPAFITSIVQFLAKHRFDGVDIQWQYPGLDGGSPDDKFNFVLFLRKLKQALKPRRWELIVSMGVKPEMLTTSYDILRISDYVDLMNLQTYGYHTGSETKTAQNSPLYASRVDTDLALNVDASITSYINLGAPRSKLSLSVAAFGISFTLESQFNYLFGAPAIGVGLAGPFLRTRGKMAYSEICRRFKNKPPWFTAFNFVVRNPYAYKRNQFITYDNVRSVTTKAKYAKDHRLAGVSVWTVDYDDATNYCGDGKYPLLRAVSKVITPLSDSLADENENLQTLNVSRSDY